MRATFYLIDLVSQCAAVERLLAGMSEAQKIDWLSAHGRLALIPKREGPQVFHFTIHALRWEHLLVSLIRCIRLLSRDIARG